MTDEGGIVLSIVVPCFNEEPTLRKCVQNILSISSENLTLEIIIVDDCSRDGSRGIALELAREHREIRVLHHKKNRGKGAALRTGFRLATGDFVAVQDADTEYDPNDLKKLLLPLINGDADVVIGSRFLSSGVHRVLYFWHYLGNRLLTFLSNMLTDLNLTDMETCYKVFRREILQNIDLEEERFGFEPEIVAKIAHLRLRIYEIGISYKGRTYEEGKKIGIKDAFRTLFCIFRYNAHHAPLPIQFLLYTIIGGFAAFTNLIIFVLCLKLGLGLFLAAPVAFVFAAIVNYILCVSILFRHKSQWNSGLEAAIYILVVAIVGFLDLTFTRIFVAMTVSPEVSKAIASVLMIIFNFAGRRFLVFNEAASGPWHPQDQKISE